MRKSILGAILFPAAIAGASCGSAQPVDSARHSSPIPPRAPGADAASPFKVTPVGTFDEPWALRFAPGTQTLFVTEKKGALRFVELPSGRAGTVTGTPQVSYGGQGGLADVAFMPGEVKPALSGRTIYLSWAEKGEGNNAGGAVGRGTLVCDSPTACRIANLAVIWRQTPKTPGQLQYALRLTFSPDGKYLYVTSGDRVHIDSVQQTDNNLGKIVRLTPDRRPAPGNPLAAKGHQADEIWTMGHRNPLGLKFDATGRQWDLEHGPAGGDELNLLKPGQNYGWPVVLNGDNYDGTPIPRHATHPEFTAPAISWNPVIAPGDFIFYSGKLWPQWRGQALIAGLRTQAIVRVSISGETAKAEARYPMGHRMRDVIEASDGSLYAIEDGNVGRLVHLTPQ